MHPRECYAAGRRKGRSKVWIGDDATTQSYPWLTQKLRYASPRMELSPSSQHDTMCKAAIIQCQRPSARARHAVVGRLAYRL